MIDCFAKLVHDDIQFKHSQMKALFQVFDNKKYTPFKNSYFKRFEDRDDEIEKLQSQVIKLFEEGDDNDFQVEHNLNILDDLDLFAFADIQVSGKTTNVLLEALAFGIEMMIDYCF